MKVLQENITPIKVAILEDDIEYRDSLKKLLSKDPRIRLYGEFNNTYDCIQSFYSPFKAQVCLIDIVLKGGSKTGLDCAKTINQNWPNTHIIFMTSYLDPSYLSEAKKINADYIEKGTRGEIIIDKIILNRKYKSKERFLSVTQTNDFIHPTNLLNQIYTAQKNTKKLSFYQRKVLKLKLDGKSVIETASFLQMNPRTVRTHLRRALQKLELPDVLKYIQINLDVNLDKKAP